MEMSAKVIKTHLLNQDDSNSCRNSLPDFIEHIQNWHSVFGRPKEWFRLVLLTDDGVGCVIADCNDEVDGQAHICGLQVDVHSRGKGIGNLLLTKMEQKLAELGIKVAVLEWDGAGSSEEVLLWYLRHGYQVLSSNTPELMRLFKILSISC